MDDINSNSNSSKSSDKLPVNDIDSSMSSHNINNLQFLLQHIDNYKNMTYNDLYIFNTLSKKYSTMKQYIYNQLLAEGIENPSDILRELEGFDLNPQISEITQFNSFREKMFKYDFLWNIQIFKWVLLIIIILFCYMIIQYLN